MSPKEWVTVRTKRFKNWFGDWEASERLRLISDSVIQIADGDVSKDEAAEHYYNLLSTVENEADGKTIRFVNSIFGKLAGHKGSSLLFRIIPQFDDVIRKSQPIYFENEANPNKHTNINGHRNYLAQVTIDGRDYFVRSTVQEKTPSRGRRPEQHGELHSAFISDIEIIKAGDTPVSFGISTPTTGIPTGFDKRVADFIAKSNDVSKVVDANGEPLVVYHGTGNLDGLSEFRSNLTGLGNDQYGSGFYFTTDSAEASSYATAITPNAAGQPKLGGDTSPGVVPAFLNIRNPINAEGHNLSDVADLTVKQAAKFIAKSPRIMDEEDSPLGDWFESYWEGGPEQWMIQDVASNYTGPSLIQIENDFFGQEGEATAFREVVYEVLKNDGVTHGFGGLKEHWVAFFPNQIKSVNNQGTFSEDASILKSVISDGGNSESVLDSLYDNNGDIDYEQVQNAVTGIFSREYRISRLDRKGEKGRIRGSRLLVGSSLIIGGSDSSVVGQDARKRRNREEDLLEAYAKSQNAWVDDIDSFRSPLRRG